MGIGKVTNLVEMQQKAVKAFGPERLFGTKRDGQYQWTTYREFGEQVDKFRGGLAKLGVEAGDRVAIISDNRVEWAVAAYATYGRAACFVPMYEHQHASDWKYILKDCAAKVAIVAKTKIYDTIAPMADELDTLQTVINMEAPDDDPSSFGHVLELGAGNPAKAANPDPEELMGFIYTSGTTGNPKGVLLTHGNIASNINAVHEIFPMSPEDTSLSFLPWAHSFGQTVELHCMMSSGAAVGIAESVATIVANMPEVRPTLLVAVPRIFNKIYDGLQKKMTKAGGVKKWMFDTAMANATLRRELAEKGESSWWVDKKHGAFDSLVFSKIREAFGGRLKYAFSGGAALNPDIARFIDNINITIYEGYGLSETSPIACANYPDNRKIGSVGKAIPGCRAEIAPVEHMKEAGVGEIVLYGPNIMKGYHGLDKETEDVFTEDGGFRTGDLGRIDDEGYVYITGRVKEQYKLENGKYVVPAPLEESLKLSPFINQIMIHGANKPFNVALIVPDLDAIKDWAASNGKGADLDALLGDADLNKAIADDIANFGKAFKGYERPRKFELIKEEFSTDNDMLTPSLKVKRRNVMTAYGEKLERLYAE
jgi:long-chain acyl-CoA synthetase